MLHRVIKSQKIVLNSQRVLNNTSAFITNKQLIHTSYVLLNEKKEEPKKQEEKTKEEEPKKQEDKKQQTFDGKTPLQIFRETFQQEWKASEELQSNIKQLQDAQGKISESEALKKAREATARSTSILSKSLKKTGEKIDSAVTTAWESEAGIQSRKFVNSTAKIVDSTVVQPVTNTKLYKDASENLNEGTSNDYGGFLTKEERLRSRERLMRERMSREDYIKNVAVDEEAGTALVATENGEGTSANKKGENFAKAVEKSAVGKGASYLKTKLWTESENPFIVLLRTINNKVSGFFFAETETGKTIKLFKDIDPNFKMEDFHKNLRDYILPEVLEAHAKGDVKTLSHWMSEAPLSVYAAQQKYYTEQGLYPDTQILDIRDIDIANSKILPGDIPVFVISLRVQEIPIYRNIKDHEISAGNDSNIMQAAYVVALTRDFENLHDEVSEGWKVIEFAKGQSRSFV